MRLSNNDIISKVNISKSTFYRNMDALLKEGAVKKTANGYSISTILFPVFKDCDQIQDFKDYLDEMAGLDENFKNDRKYKTFYYYYDRDFDGLRMSPEKFATELEAGTFFNKDKHLARNKKKEEEKVYYF